MLTVTPRVAIIEFHLLAGLAFILPGMAKSVQLEVAGHTQTQAAIARSALCLVHTLTKATACVARFLALPGGKHRCDHGSKDNRFLLPLAALHLLIKTMQL